MNNGWGYLLAGIFLFLIFDMYPAIKQAGLPETEKVRIFEQKKHDVEVQALFEKQQEQKIDALLKKNFNEVSNDDMPTWLFYSLLQSNVAKLAVVIIIVAFGGLFIVKRV